MDLSRVQGIEGSGSESSFRQMDWPPFDSRWRIKKPEFLSGMPSFSQFSTQIRLITASTQSGWLGVQSGAS